MNDKNPYILVLGASIVDIFGLCGRSYAQRDSIPGHIKISFGGVCRNIAENLARVGVETKFISTLGDDENGKSIFEHSKKLGYSMNTTDLKEINEAKDVLMKQKDLVLAYVNDEGKDRLLGEEVAMGIIYSGDAVTLMDENPNLDYAIPKEGSNKWVDAMCIPKTAQNKKEAELFINFLLDPENAKINAEYIGYSIPNEGALKLLDKEITENPVAYPSQEVLNKCETFIDLGDKIKLYDRAWIELKSE